MEAFVKLFGKCLVFSYHCFDRIVIHGYLSMLSRPENVVYFFRKVVGVRAVTKEVLVKRTRDYQKWVESFARNHGIHIQWAEKKVRKEDFVQPFLARMEREGRCGVYFIFRSKEQGPTFHSRKPDRIVRDPDHHILSKRRTPFTHYYFYIRDEVLGPMVLRVASFLPFQVTAFVNGHNFMAAELNRAGVQYRKKDNAFLAVSDPQALQAAADRFTPALIRERLDYWTFLLGPKFSERERREMNLRRFFSVAQVEYCRNFIFKRNFLIRRLFERSCEMGLLTLTADKISKLFGQRLNRRMRGQLKSVLKRMDQVFPVLRAELRNSFLKQYEKFLTFLRNEVCCNDLAKDFGLKKGLEHLDAVRTKLLGITDRFAAFQAQALNVHFDFPLLQRLALPVLLGQTKIPGIKIQDTRLIRLMEVLLHSGGSLPGWRTAGLHTRIVRRYDLEAERYTPTQLRYDMRKLRAHGLLEREGRRYQYRLTEKGAKVAVMFALFHKRICGPLANSLFQHQPNEKLKLDSELEAAYYEAERSLQKIIELVAA